MATAPIRPPAWVPPHAAGTALKRQKEDENASFSLKKKKLQIIYLLVASKCKELTQLSNKTNNPIKNVCMI